MAVGFGKEQAQELVQGFAPAQLATPKGPPVTQAKTPTGVGPITAPPPPVVPGPPVTQAKTPMGVGPITASPPPVVPGPLPVPPGGIDPGGEEWASRPILSTPAQTPSDEWWNRNRWKEGVTGSAGNWLPNPYYDPEYIAKYGIPEESVPWIGEYNYTKDLYPKEYAQWQASLDPNELRGIPGYNQEDSDAHFFNQWMTEQHWWTQPDATPPDEWERAQGWVQRRDGAWIDPATGEIQVRRETTLPQTNAVAQFAAMGRSGLPDDAWWQANPWERGMFHSETGRWHENPFYNPTAVDPDAEPETVPIPRFPISAYPDEYNEWEAQGFPGTQREPGFFPDWWTVDQEEEFYFNEWMEGASQRDRTTIQQLTDRLEEHGLAMDDLETMMNDLIISTGEEMQDVLKQMNDAAAAHDVALADVLAQATVDRQAAETRFDTAQEAAEHAAKTAQVLHLQQMEAATKRYDESQGDWLRRLGEMQTRSDQRFADQQRDFATRQAAQDALRSQELTTQQQRFLDFQQQREDEWQELASQRDAQQAQDRLQREEMSRAQAEASRVWQEGLMNDQQRFYAQIQTNAQIPDEMPTVQEFISGQDIFKANAGVIWQWQGQSWMPVGEIAVADEIVNDGTFDFRAWLDQVGARPLTQAANVA